uniref:Uncharacterized protein n=1 Tax=uncultured Alphaproteobacteria bacterium TaxID=91750 RepID=A0A6G8F1V3_9PROT|nr:hypothetical protein PlAlph_0590 [uncultured Alphaproteobacteria bacterium]
MKKIATLVMFTFLAMTGYYVGAAVAQSYGTAAQSAAEVAAQDKDNAGNGVLIMEEYDAVVTPAVLTPAEAAKAADNKNKNMDNSPVNAAGLNPSDNSVIVGESVSETEIAD